jgi:hypothetical protein
MARRGAAGNRDREARAAKSLKIGSGSARACPVSMEKRRALV